MMNDIGELLPQGIKLTLNNTIPLPQSGEGVFYYIEQGSVNLFLARRMSNGKTGAQYPLCTAESGEFVFPLSGNDTEVFIDIAEQDTCVRILQLSDLWELYRRNDPEVQEAADFALFLWFSKLSSPLTGHTILGKKKLFIPAKRPVHLEKETLFAAEAGTVSWLTVDDRTSYFCKNNMPADSTGTVIPLTSSIWAQTNEDCDITLCTTAQLKDFSAALRQFHSLCCSMLIALKENKIHEENERIKNKDTVNNEQFKRTLGLFASLLDEKDSFHFSEQQQPIVQALMMVAEKQKQKLIPPSDRQYEQTPDGLIELAQDMNLRIRRITLAPQWYKTDMGNMCSFMIGADGKPVPVALIKNRRHYIIINAQTMEKIIATEETVQQLSTDAWYIYRSLPNRPLSLRDIIHFTFQNETRELPVYFILGLAIACFGLLLTKMMQLFYDDFIPQAAKNQMTAVVILLIVAQIVSLLFSLTQNYALTRFSIKTETNLNSALWDRILRLPVDFFRNFTAGDLTERGMMMQQIQEILFDGVISNVVGCSFTLIYFFQMFSFNKTLALTAFIITIVMMIITAVLCTLAYKHQKKIIRLNNTISGILLQFINGIAKLRVTAAEKHAFGIWADKYLEEKREFYKSGKYHVVLNTLLPLFPLISMAILYTLYPHAISKSPAGNAMLTTGTFMAFMSLFQTFQNSLLTMTTTVVQSLTVIPMYEQAQPILAMQPEISETKERVQKLSGDIDIRHVSFKYAPDLPFVLNDVSLEIHAGEFIAIVGGSGSGKSTLMRLLLGFEHASSGSIYFDKQEINSLDITSLRRQIGVVLQTSMIVQGSIYENVAGTGNLPAEYAWDALRMVDLEQTVKDMPMGIHTVLPTGGTTLSGGQRQRILIARSLVRRPPILLLDEATSALDNKTQANVAASLENLHVTRIVVAHRLSTIIHADRIYVLQNGQITESGTYNQLMRNKQYFYELAMRQSL